MRILLFSQSHGDLGKIYYEFSQQKQNLHVYKFSTT